MKQEPIEEMVERELKEHTERCGKFKGNQGYFNNFHVKLLPDEVSFYRLVSKEQGNWDEPNKKVHGTDSIKHSQLFLNQTPREFYGIIDEIMSEQKISVGELEELSKTKSDYEDSHFRIWAIVKPVYVKLREKGYTAEELRT